MSGKGDKPRTKKYKQYRDNYNLINWDDKEVLIGPGDVAWKKKPKKTYGRRSR